MRCLESQSTLAVILLLAAVTILPTVSFGQAPAESDVISVKMVDRGGAQWRFEPAHVSVEPGDTVRFVQEDVVPHNVEFTKMPRGSELGDSKLGPFLMTKGETYDVVIDHRFAAGRYDYICTPHEAMGMTGAITVDDVGVVSSE